MSASNSTITPGNFELSPCRVTFKGVDIGATLGNVVIKNKTSLAELKSDQLGSTPIDKRVSGHSFQIDTEFAEVKFKPNWKVLFPMHKLVTQGNSTLFIFDSQVGFSQVGAAGLLTLHPLSLPDTDVSEDFNVFLAAAQGQADYEFSPSAQVKLKCTWDVYPDFSTSPPRFYYFGDKNTGLIAASAGAATAGTGNTGVGTVTGITAFSGYTKTEVITLQCQAPGAAGTFFVKGSLSGPLGLATVGIAFNGPSTNPEIAFTINDGTPHFVTNDSFTIATTAANYG
jgi:hypothetical protein